MYTTGYILQSHFTCLSTNTVDLHQNKVWQWQTDQQIGKDIPNKETITKAQSDFINIYTTQFYLFYFLFYYTTWMTKFFFIINHQPLFKWIKAKLKQHVLNGKTFKPITPITLFFFNLAIYDQRLFCEG